VNPRATGKSKKSSKKTTSTKTTTSVITNMVFVRAGKIGNTAPGLHPNSLGVVGLLVGMLGFLML
jgi:hypothetical protein